jgi:protein-arginine kinase activator protein McsA
MKMVYSLRKVWKQASGLVIRTIKQKKTIWKVLAPELLINEQLEIAIINEDYENAAILRDKIKKKRQANKKLSLLVTNIKV